MDLERKIELMKKYDFDNFGNNLSLIYICLSNLRFKNDKKDGEKFIGHIDDAYGWLKSCYENINFDSLREEINEEDEDDFATLFLTKDLLIELGRAIDNYVDFVRANNYCVHIANKVYERVSNCITEIKRADMHQGITYRMRIFDLEGRLKEKVA